MNFKTVAFKGSKRKLLKDIEKLVEEVKAETFLDGFSGSGIVSAYFRHKGYHVFSNDKMPSSNLYSRVFLNGYNASNVEKHIKHINDSKGKADWLTNNYSGEVKRKIKGINKIESRPLGFTRKNAMKLDEAREYAEIILDSNDKDAVIFSIVLAMNKVFNNSNDQKSCFKEWMDKAKKDVVFEMPTLVKGIKGQVFTGDVNSIPRKNYDFVYLDPPYTNGVLYDSCYHLNNSMVLWDKPSLDKSYAIPRPSRVVFRKNKKTAGKFYSKKTAKKDFENLIGHFDAKRIVLSYSDAPRNILSREQLIDVCENFGNVQLIERKHKICTQNKKQKKVSNDLKEFFFVIDKK
jgi:adenine-specific DNA methylase